MIEDLNTTSLAPVSRESTASVIARQVRNAIMDGSLPPGSQLGEHLLAGRLQVSRGVLREALQRLVQEGLLRSEHNRGLFVTEIDADAIHDIYLTRTAIERAAAAAVLDRDPVGSATRLAEVVERMVAAADLNALGDADLAFHQTLVEEARSPRLSRMHETLLVETRMCLTKLEDTYHDPDVVVTEHRDIVAAIRDRDRRRVGRLLTAHADDALSRLVPDTGEHGERRRQRRIPRNL